MAFLMSLKTSTSFNVVDNKPYDNDVYKIEQGDPPDYRELYGVANGEKIIKQCNHNNYAGNSKRYSSGSDGYWFVNGQDAPTNMTDIKSTVNKDGNLILEELFTDQVNIIAPFNCILETKSLANDCTNMTVSCTIKGTDYKITISGMYCWYCDVGRDEDELTGHTGKEQLGKKFRGGQVLGRATEKTKIKIKAIVPKTKKYLKNHNSTKAYVNTLNQFYEGLYGYDENDLRDGT